MMRKGRNRIKRGRLQNFEDLPFCKQHNFKVIAAKIKELDKTINDVYVYGSHFWGYWDKYSDYDVRINQSFMGSYDTLKKELSDLKIDLMVHKEPRIKMNLITIPR